MWRSLREVMSDPVLPTDMGSLSQPNTTEIHGWAYCARDAVHSYFQALVS